MPVVQLIRHGQASFGAADYDVLSGTGHQQAEALAAALLARGVQPDRMVAGSLRRQQDTATTCAGAAHWNLPLENDPRLDEYDHVTLLREQEAATGPGPEFGPGAGRAVQQALDAALLGWVRSGRPGSDGRTFTQWCEDAVAAQRDLLGSLGRAAAPAWSSAPAG